MPNVQAVENMLLLVVRLLVRYPESVNIETTLDAEKIIYIIKTESSDLGRVLGPKGRTVTAIREIIDAIGSYHNLHLTMKVGS